MPKITVPAAKIEQDGKVLFLPRFTVADLITPGFYRVPKLVVGEKDQKDEGFQRGLDEKRAKKFADYIDEVGVEAFLPTSLFLAAEKEKEIAHDAAKGAITFETSGSKLRPFFHMVDGQHRAAGLQKAAEQVDKHWLRDFSVPAVIATGLNNNEQMVQFLIVNTTQKKVSANVAQQILAQFTREDGVEAMMPILPKIIRNKMGPVDKALSLVNHLNTALDSPWQGKILMANQSKEAGTTTNQSMLVGSLNKCVLVREHQIGLEEDNTKRCKMLTNYWAAVAAQFSPDGENMDIPLFKTVGIDIFHSASLAVFKHLVRNGQPFTTENFHECLQSASEFIGDGCADIYAPDFWKRGGVASGFNRTSSSEYAAALSRAVEQIPRNTTIKTK